MKFSNQKYYSSYKILSQYSTMLFLISLKYKAQNLLLTLALLHTRSLSSYVLNYIILSFNSTIIINKTLTANTPSNLF